jgi:hypothetical protein
MQAATGMGWRRSARCKVAVGGGRGQTAVEVHRVRRAHRQHQSKKSNHRDRQLMALRYAFRVWAGMERTDGYRRLNLPFQGAPTPFHGWRRDRLFEQLPSGHGNPARPAVERLGGSA